MIMEQCNLKQMKNVRGKLLEPLSIDGRCIRCYTCIESCPNNCLRVDKEHFIHNYVKCTHCGVCQDSCPKNALTINWE